MSAIFRLGSEACCLVYGGCCTFNLATCPGSSRLSPACLRSPSCPRICVCSMDSMALMASCALLRIARMSSHQETLPHVRFRMSLCIANWGTCATVCRSSPHGQLGPVNFGTSPAKRKSFGPIFPGCSCTSSGFSPSSRTLCSWSTFSVGVGACLLVGVCVHQVSIQRYPWPLRRRPYFKQFPHGLVSISLIRSDHQLIRKT